MFLGVEVLLLLYKVDWIIVLAFYGQLLFELVCQGVCWFEVKQAQAPVLMKKYCLALPNFPKGVKNIVQMKNVPVWRVIV